MSNASPRVDELIVTSLKRPDCKCGHPFDKHMKITGTRKPVCFHTNPSNIDRADTLISSRNKLQRMAYDLLKIWPYTSSELITITDSNANAMRIALRELESKGLAEKTQEKRGNFEGNRKHSHVWRAIVKTVEIDGRCTCRIYQPIERIIYHSRPSNARLLSRVERRAVHNAKPINIPIEDKQAEEKVEPVVTEPKLCLSSSCGHPQVSHMPKLGYKYNPCWEPDCKCKQFRRRKSLVEGLVTRNGF